MEDIVKDLKLIAHGYGCTGYNANPAESGYRLKCPIAIINKYKSCSVCEIPYGRKVTLAAKMYLNKHKRIQKWKKV